VTPELLATKRLKDGHHLPILSRSQGGTGDPLATERLKEKLAFNYPIGAAVMAVAKGLLAAERLKDVLVLYFLSASVARWPEGQSRLSD
jgi:hypothetical protein